MLDKVELLDQVALDSLTSPNLYGNITERPLETAANESLSSVYLDLAADATLNAVFPGELTDEFAIEYLSDI
ncbi:hypothetical protein AN641_00505 [Candidatus Epulonipiscioides gigas]|nr:hypothetical protein AN641_00505 [Epulopiscium sp. SCG-C07WGA-EpuloA2]